jgi:uncharacterized membrane protein YfcA
VPALVYVLGQSAQDATTGSVIIVGVTAAAGVLAHRRNGVDRRIGIAFAAVGVPAAWLGTLLNRHVSQPALLLAFAALTVFAAAAMLFNSRADAGDDVRPTGGAAPMAVAARTDARRLVMVAKIVVCGAAVGFLTGFLGVGGGFLVVPALVIVLRMPMSRAVGTSLLIILVNSAASVVSRIGDLHLDWTIIAPFTIAAVLGTVAGKRVADRLSGPTLVRAFALLLLGVGLFVGAENLL